MSTFSSELSAWFDAMHAISPVSVALGSSTLRAVQDEENATDAFIPGAHDDRRDGAVMVLRADCAAMPKRGDRIVVAGKSAKVLSVHAEANDPVLRLAYGSILAA